MSTDVSRELNLEGNLMIHKKEDFNIGGMEHLKLNEKLEIALEEGQIEGRYLSPIIYTEKFIQLVASWNVNTPQDTGVELSYRVKADDQWSMWFSYGKWSSDGARGSVSNQEDGIAIMDVDTVDIRGNKSGEALQYKIILIRGTASIESPRVRNISTTLKLCDPKEVAALANEDWVKDLPVPERSQMIVPVIGNVICSPTSVSMVMAYYGVNLDTEEVAEGVLDHTVDIYGNWSYNAAYAGSRGFDAYVARYDSIEDIKEKISEGIPVIASIKTKTEDVIKDAPQTYPSGHLLVVRGFIMKGNEEYVIVNDPAVTDPSAVRREYDVPGFEKAWSKVVYILTPEE